MIEPSIYHIKGGRLEMTVSNYGARVLSLLVPDKYGVKADVIVGYKSMDDYLSCPGERFFGAAVGRLANRLGGASFVLDGKEYRTSRNDNGNTLHGGLIGLDRALWDVKEVQPDSITFFLRDPAGQDGWPGNLDIRLKYTLTGEDSFLVEYTATTDAPTLCNLSHHSFFNLSGDSSKSIQDHILQIDAEKFVVINDKLIPSGELCKVEGTPFDFRTAKAIGQDIAATDVQLKYAGGYDHNWCLAGEGFRRAASLYEPESGRRMEVWTDQPGIQFYSGNFFDGSYAGKGDRKIGHRCALALETQIWPDAIHHPAFPSCVLRPGETYKHNCAYHWTNE